MKVLLVEINKTFSLLQGGGSHNSKSPKCNKADVRSMNPCRVTFHFERHLRATYVLMNVPLRLMTVSQQSRIRILGH